MANESWMYELFKVKPHRVSLVEPDTDSTSPMVSNRATLAAALLYLNPPCLKNATAKRFPGKSCLHNTGQSARLASLFFSASLERAWKPVLKPLRLVLLPAEDGIVFSYVLRLCSMIDEWQRVIKCSQQQRDYSPAHFCLCVPESPAVMNRGIVITNPAIPKVVLLAYISVKGGLYI